MFGFLKRHGFEILLVAVLLAGACVMAYPKVSDLWNRMVQNRSIDNYQASVERISSDDRKAMLEEAYAYNRMLLSAGSGFKLSEEQTEEYLSILDVTGTGIMGYLDIPAIDVHLPIGHGTDETVLQQHVGHVAGSSLPVGGGGTHALLSGHRGLPSAVLFTHLDRLKEGDAFMVTVLSETCTYEVDRISIVLPEEVDGLTIEPGRDYVTLITCTPYGVNTHRLLVRGHRIENAEAVGSVRVSRDGARIQAMAVLPFLFWPLLIATVIGSLFRKGRAERTTEELMAELDAFRRRRNDNNNGNKREKEEANDMNDT